MPARDGEDVTRTILELVEKFGRKHQQKRHIHRLPPPPIQKKKSTGRTRNRAPEIKHPPISVRFVIRYKRNQVFISRFKSKEINNFPVENL